MFDLKLTQTRVVTATASFDAEIGITDGKIAAVGTNLGPARESLDASGRWVLPGGVDPHCHIEQMSGMGLMNADTWETASRSALMGGTTSVISFAAQTKGQRMRDAVADYAARAERGAMVDHGFHMILADPQVDALDDDIAALVATGHRTIKIFTTYNIGLDDAQILQVLALAKAHGALICVHAENDALIKSTTAALIARGMTRPEHHALSHPRTAEIEAIDRMCRFAEHLDQPVMIFHVSTREGAAAVRAARRRGAPIWAETCPHYLLMTDDVLRADGLDGAKFMCSPPQRGRKDQDALWTALGWGDLDVISSDHAPYRFDETGKLSAGPDARFDQIANGLPGLEVRLPLMFDAMISQGRMSPSDFVRLTSTAPAHLYGLAQKGQIAPGFDADLVLWDPDRTVKYGGNDLHDNVGYNPWEATQVTGWPETVLLRGQVVVQNGECWARPGQGQWIARSLTTTSTGRPSAEVAALEATP